MPPRATRASSSKKADKASSSKKSTKKAPLKQATPDTDDDDSGDAYGEDQEEEDDAESINSDNLDDEPPKKQPQKRKRAASSSSKASPKKKPVARKRRKAKDDDDEEDDFELEEGQEIVGVVVQAPRTGRVPPGQISRNTLDFLSQLKKPECNDRQWFKLQEPVYRLAEKEWKDFVESFTDVLIEADSQIPYLPPKDVIHRVYRDVRFSNDKTPYKTNFSATFSRGGRKGIFACYHISLNPGSSMMAAGAWQPGRDEIALIRANLMRSSKRFRRIISDPQFVGLFGPPKPSSTGRRCSIFGRDDELKVAPKGVDKNHKDIDLLKLRSFAVALNFTDKQVLQPDFKEELGRVAKIMRPFVHCLNDLMTIQDMDDEDDESDEEDSEDEDEAQSVSKEDLQAIIEAAGPDDELEDFESVEDEVSRVD